MVEGDTSADVLHGLVTELYPVCRSITGPGLRATLSRIGEEIPLTLHEVPTGTKVLDWEIPREWSIRDAYIEDPSGRRVVDFRDHNLHVVSYSGPVDQVLSMEELRPHLHSLPDHPDWIPYRTTYYRESWGFCLQHRVLEAMGEPSYRVRIDASLEPGSLTYAECSIPGASENEVLVSVHCCHPSLANDNLSGIAVAIGLAGRLAESPRKLSYRFVFAPGTIGAIAWLDRNRDRVDRVKHGLVLTCVGDGAPFTYKRSRRGDADVDRAMAHLLQLRGDGSRVVDFEPYGYDERQYCSPGFNLPVGCLMRSRHGEFPEYHTSADDPGLVRGEFLSESVGLCASLFDLLEENVRYRSSSPFGEPQLGRRGLYRAVGGDALPGLQSAMLWVLNLSDGDHSLLDIADRAQLPFSLIRSAAQVLREAELLVEVTTTT